MMGKRLLILWLLLQLVIAGALAEEAPFADFAQALGEEISFQATGGDLYQDVLEQLGGRSFGNGLLRIFRPEDIQEYTDDIHRGFRGYEGTFRVFAYDWQGRIFAEALDEEGCIYRYDIGRGVAERFPATLLSFFDQVCLMYPDEVLGFSDFLNWLGLFGPLAYEDCASYLVPPYLGGEETLDNMEVTSLTVHWGLFSQIHEAIQDYPEGTAFQFSIDEE